MCRGKQRGSTNQKTKESEKRPPELQRMRCRCSDERPEVKWHAELSSVASAVNSSEFAVDRAESAVCSSEFAVNCVESAVDFPAPAKSTRSLAVFRREAPSACLLPCVGRPWPWLVLLHRHRARTHGIEPNPKHRAAEPRSRAAVPRRTTAPPRRAVPRRRAQRRSAGRTNFAESPFFSRICGALCEVFHGAP